MQFIGTRKIDNETRVFVDVAGRTYPEVAEVVWRTGGVVGWWRRADGSISGWVSRDLLAMIAAYLWPGVAVSLA